MQNLSQKLNLRRCANTVPVDWLHGLSTCLSTAKIQVQILVIISIQSSSQRYEGGAYKISPNKLDSESEIKISKVDWIKNTNPECQKDAKYETIQKVHFPYKFF